MARDTVADALALAVTLRNTLARARTDDAAFCAECLADARTCAVAIVDAVDEAAAANADRAGAGDAAVPVARRQQPASESAAPADAPKRLHASSVDDDVNAYGPPF